MPPKRSRQVLDTGAPRPHITGPLEVCANCGATESSVVRICLSRYHRSPTMNRDEFHLLCAQWRRRPTDKQRLCNSCGLYFLRCGQDKPYRIVPCPKPSPSNCSLPSFSSMFAANPPLPAVGSVGSVGPPVPFSAPLPLAPAAAAAPAHLVQADASAHSRIPAAILSAVTAMAVKYADTSAARLSIDDLIADLYKINESCLQHKVVNPVSIRSLLNDDDDPSALVGPVSTVANAGNRADTIDDAFAAAGIDLNAESDNEDESDEEGDEEKSDDNANSTAPIDDVLKLLATPTQSRPAKRARH